jgi:hypothetical protein
MYQSSVHEDVPTFLSKTSRSLVRMLSKPRFTESASALGETPMLRLCKKILLITQFIYANSYFFFHEMFVEPFSSRFDTVNRSQLWRFSNFWR